MTVSSITPVNNYVGNGVNKKFDFDFPIEDKNELRDITWIRIRTTNKLKGIIKVRVNHVGKIVKVGEYL